MGETFSTELTRSTFSSVLSFSTASLLKGDGISQLKKALRANGWCFVTLDHDSSLPELIQSVAKAAQIHCFSHAAPVLFNQRYGYDVTSKKKALRLLTGGFGKLVVDRPELGLATEAQKSIPLLTAALDTLCTNLISVLAKPLFGSTLASLGSDQE